MSIPKLKIIIEEAPTKCLVYIDDEPIGPIQNIRAEVSCNYFFTKVNIEFIDFFDERYFDCDSDLAKNLAYTIERLEKIPNVSITLKSLYDADT